MSMQFRKAEKKRQKLRLGLFGVSGSGKTMSALRIAAGLGKKIAVIDSEGGSSELYSDRYAFDVLPLESHQLTPDSYVDAMEIAAKEGYEVVVIDSFSHAWFALREEVDRIAKAKYRGNTWSAWSEGNPMQRRLTETILRYPCHLLATMRSATEWTIEENNGKKNPVRVGTSPEQGKGIEFEFTMLLEMTPEHFGRFIKDRTGKFQDRIIEKPDEILGQQLLDWLNTGAESTSAPLGMSDEEFQKKVAAIATLDSSKLPVAAAKIRESNQYSPSQRDKLLSLIESRSSDGGAA